MPLFNSPREYGLISRFIHWLSACAVLGLFASGLWMTGLDYYNEWYQTAPNLHRSVGVALLALTVLRIFWFRLSPKPKPLQSIKGGERIAAVAVHHLMLILVFVMAISGYLITTAQGDPLYVFGLFSLPSITQGVDNLEDYAGKVHYFAAFTLIALLALHVLAALKHQFLDKDETLQRMLG